MADPNLYDLYERFGRMQSDIKTLLEHGTNVEARTRVLENWKANLSGRGARP